MIRIFAFVAMVACVSPLFAATLTVDAKIVVGSAAESGDSEQPRQLAVFVLDRSQSMVKHTFRNESRTRDVELKQRLKKRIEGLSAETEVFYFAFGSTVRPFLTPQVVTDDASRAALYQKMADLPLETFTLLYDAEEQALDFVRKEFEKDPLVRAEVYLYTDGDHQTDLCVSSYPAEYYLNVKSKKSGKMVHKRDVWGDLAENPNYVKDKESAFQKFQAKYAELRKDPRLTIVQEYLGDGNTPDTSKWSVKPVCAVKVQVLPNVLAKGKDQKIAARIRIPLEEMDWKKIEGLAGILQLNCNGKTVDRPFMFKRGVQSIVFDLPDVGTAEASASLMFTKVPQVAGVDLELQQTTPVSLTIK